MKLWFEIVYEKKGFWFFSSYKGHDLVKAETANEALHQIEIPLDWQIRLIQPVSKKSQLNLDALSERNELKEKMEQKTK